MDAQGLVDWMESVDTRTASKSESQNEDDIESRGCPMTRAGHGSSPIASASLASRPCPRCHIAFAFAGLQTHEVANQIFSAPRPFREAFSCDGTVAFIGSSTTPKWLLRQRVSHMRTFLQAGSSWALLGVFLD